MNKKVIFLHFFALVSGIVMNIVHPITPMYLRNLNISDYMFGIFFAVMNLGVFISSPFWGNLGDRKQKRFIIALGFFGYAICQFLFGSFSNPLYIGLARFGAGFFIAAFQVATLAYLLDEKFENQKMHLSIYLALIVLGASFGYLIGGHLGEVYPTRTIFYIQSLSSIGMVLLSLGLIEKKKEDVSVNRNPFSPFKALKELDSKLTFLFIVIVVANMAIINFSKYIDLYIDDLNYSSKMIGNINFVSGLVTIVVTLFIVPKLLNKVKPIRLGIISLFFAGVFSFIVFIMPNKYFLILVYSLFMVYISFKTIYEPAIINHINEQKGSTGILMGLRQSALALGAVIGPLLGGLLYNEIKVYLFVVLSLLLIIASGLLMIYQKRRTKV